MEGWRISRSDPPPFHAIPLPLFAPCGAFRAIKNKPRLRRACSSARMQGFIFHNKHCSPQIVRVPYNECAPCLIRGRTDMLAVGHYASAAIASARPLSDTGRALSIEALRIVRNVFLPSKVEFRTRSDELFRIAKLFLRNGTKAGEGGAGRVEDRRLRSSALPKPVPSAESKVKKKLTATYMLTCLPSSTPPPPHL